MKIEHTALYVSDLERARKFFEGYFGAVSNDIYVNRRTGFRSYFLTFDEGTRLEIMQRPDVVAKRKNSPHTGYSHIAFSVGSREIVDALTELLLTDGYSVVSGPRTTGDGCYESCIVDSEGNLIEITI